MSRQRANPSSPRSTDIDPDEESLLRRSPNLKPRNKPPGSSRAKALFHKICLMSPRDSHEGREGVIGLLQDIVGGIVLGTLGMSMLLLLDYSNIINLETARVFRKTASDIFNAPEILESIKDEIGKDLISMDEYNAMKKELADSKAVIDNEQKIIAIRTAKDTSLNAELSSLRGEYDKLIKETGLDAFCPTCHWGMGMNCQQRVNYMLETYSDSATSIGCVNKLVDQGKKNGKCLKSS
ncbi:hypothetical protein ACHAXR_010859 [Thalassiosira sp. AJA248-18]